jgi:hypothetical protein
MEIHWAFDPMNKLVHSNEIECFYLSEIKFYILVNENWDWNENDSLDIIVIKLCHAKRCT